MLMSFNVEVRSLETEYSIPGFIGQAAIPYSPLSPGSKAHRLHDFVYMSTVQLLPRPVCVFCLYYPSFPLIFGSVSWRILAFTLVSFVLCVYGSPVGNLERVSITGKTDWDLGLERLGFLL